MNWQPIETAPKDGRRILVCGGNVTEPEIARRWSNGRVECERDASYALPSDTPDMPTYWMPLPEIPK